MGKAKQKTARRSKQPKPTKAKTGDSSSPKSVGSKAASHDIEVIARGCLIERSKVLLCRNREHGYFYLPGGHVEFGESAAAAVGREFVEETGERVRVGMLALASEGSFSTKKRMHHEVNLVFHVERFGGRTSTEGGPARVKSREPHIEFEWVELAAVVDRDVRPVSAKAWLSSLGAAEHGGVVWVSEFAG